MKVENRKKVKKKTEKMGVKRERKEREWGATAWYASTIVCVLSDVWTGLLVSRIEDIVQDSNIVLNQIINQNYICIR
jgi:hypothetical protein